MHLAERDAIAVFARETAAFGTVRRALRVDDESRLRVGEDTWLDVGAASDSLYWAVASACTSTKQGLAAAHRLPAHDRSMDAAELQLDVNVTLSSLVQHEARVDALTPPTRPYAAVERLVGRIGPVVLGGRGGDETLRAVQFAMPAAEDVLVLLPHAYVEMALERHLQEGAAPSAHGGKGVSGYLVLRDDDAIRLRVPDVAPSEQSDASQSLGTRIWRLPPRAAASEEVASAIAKAPTVTAGSVIPSPPGTTIYWTATDVMDPLAGLSVACVFAPGGVGRDLPTLSVVKS